MLTADDLDALSERFATKDDLAHQLEPYDEALFDGLGARINALEERTFGTLPNHEERIGALELRVTAFEPRRRSNKR